jgi:predicted transcriptional regulator
VFSIILSLFGAWVGAVLAFYFGSQSLDKAYSSLSQAQSSIDKIVSDNKLAGIKVNEIIGKNPDSQSLLKYKLDDKINTIVKGAEERNYSFVMVTDATGNKVLGLLFISDLTAIKSKTGLVNLVETLEKFITDNEVNDTITKRRWVKEGMINFVTASTDDSLNTVVDKMKQLNNSLSVRAVVMDKGVPIATITYDMISKEIRK